MRWQFGCRNRILLTPTDVLYFKGYNDLCIFIAQVIWISASVIYCEHRIYPHPLFHHRFCCQCSRLQSYLWR